MKKTLTLDELIKDKVIQKDLKKISKTFQQELAQQALLDMEDAYQSVIDQFYNGYSPTSYKRHKKRGFGNTLTEKKIISSKGGNSSVAYIKGSPYGMIGYYRKNPSNIYDLIWNQGIRGLPQEGSKPLTHSFDWLGNHFEQGEIWKNPFWSGGEPYNNIFNPTISQNGQTTLPGVPASVMSQFVYNWDLFNGVKTCDRIAKQIRKQNW